MAYRYVIQSSSPKSLFNATWDPAHMIEFTTSIDLDTVTAGVQPLKISIPLKELIVPAEKMGLCKHVILVPARGLKRESDYQLRGTVAVYDDSGTLLGTLRYFHVNSSRMENQSPATISEKIPLFDEPAPAPSSAIQSPTFSYNPFGQPATPSAPAPSKYQPSYFFSKVGLSGYESVFDHVLASAIAESVPAGSLCSGVRHFNGEFHPEWAYMPGPAVQALQDYYSVTDPNVLMQQGYSPDQAAAENLYRAELRGSFPLDTAAEEWTTWLAGYGDRTAERIGIFVKTDAQMIYDLIARSPKAGTLAFVIEDVKALLAAAQARASNKTAAADAVKGSLRDIIVEIRAVEYTTLNWQYFNYVAEGLMPSSFINQAIEAYNKRKERVAAAQAKTGLIFGLISLALTPIPVVGMGFATAIQMAGAVTNLRKVQSAASHAAEQADAVAAELDIAGAANEEFFTGQAEAAAQVNRETESRYKKLALIGTGIVGVGAAIWGLS